MATIKQFIAKKTPEKGLVDARLMPTVEPANTPVIVQAGKQDKAREIYHQFAAIQQQHGQWVIPYERGKRMRACLKKLVKTLQELEGLGIQVDISEFILAQRDVWGDDFMPHHLISRDAMRIYESYQQNKRAEVITLTKNQLKEYNDTTVSRLALLRGETPEQVTALLETYDLI